MKKMLIERLIRFAKRKGVVVIKHDDHVPSAPRRDYYLCPFNGSALAIEWEQKVLHYAPHAVWPEMIHELAHILACTTAPPKSDEWSFFGWEYQVAWHLSGHDTRAMSEWRKNNSDYSVGVTIVSDMFDTVSELSDKQFRIVMDDRVSEARTNKLLNPRGIPLAIR